MTKEEILFTTKRMHPELVYNMTKLEGNPYTYSQVKTLLEGITVGGRKLSDQEQVLRVSNAWEELRYQVAQSSFTVTKANFIHFNKIVAEGEALSVGSFRTGRVYIAGVESYTPPKSDELEACFNWVMQRFNQESDPYLKAFRLFLDCARIQFFYDGNKRTAQLMMNGYLMSNGYPPVSIPAKNKRQYDAKMTKFYETGDDRAMLAFLQKLAQSPRFSI